MRRNILLIAVALATILGMTLILDRESAPTIPAEPAPYNEISDIVAQPAPDFTLKSLDDTRDQTLSAFKGKVVILHFWASWCAPCVIEFPKLIEMAQANTESIVVLAVSIDSNQADLARFLKRVQFTPIDNFLITQDADKSISQDLFQTIRVPETIIIDPSGNMVRKIAGDTEWQSPEMATFLSTLAAPRPIP